MKTKAIKNAEGVEVVLGEKPFVHPGNLSAKDLSTYLSDLAGRLRFVEELQSGSTHYREMAPIAQRRFEEARAELLEEGGLLLQESTLEVDLQKAPVAASDPEFPDHALTSPAGTTRSPTPAEVEVFQAMLSGALTEVHVDGLKAAVIEIAIAVRAGFEEFYRPATTANSALKL